MTRLKRRALAGLGAATLLCQTADAERPEVLWTRAGHAETVLSAELTPDGERIVSSSLDGSIKVWDADGNMLYSLNRFGPSALSPEGQRIAISAVGFQGGGVDIRHVSDGALLRKVGGNNTFAAPAWSPDGQMVAEVTQTGLRIWNAAVGGHVRDLLGHTGAVRCGAWSPDGAFLVSGAGLQGVDNTARVWSAATGQQLHTLTGHSDYIYCSAVSPDSQTIATGSGDHTIKLWNAQSGAWLRTLSGSASTIFDCAFSPDGLELASVDIGGPLRIWRVSDGTLQQLVPIAGGGRSVSYSSDGQTLVVGTWNGPVELRSTADGALIRTMGVQRRLLHGLRFSADGRTLAYGHDEINQSRATRVRARDGALLSEQVFAGYPNDRGLEFSPNLALTTTLGGFNTDALLWDTVGGAAVGALTGHVSVIFDWEFSPDGQFFATAGEYQAGLWHVPTGQFQRWFVDTVAASNRSVIFSPDGGRVAIGVREDVRVFDVATGTLLHDLSGAGFEYTTVAFSPDGTLLAAGSTDFVFVWRLADEALLWSDTPDRESAGTGLIFSADGKRLFTSGRAGVIEIRDARTGAVLTTFDEETGLWITSLAMGPGDRTFAYARADATLVVARNPFWTVGDVDADGCVDLDDLLVVLSDFGQLDAPAADLDDDGITGLDDLLLVLGNFNGGCP